jgi:hypothetical protein
MPSFARRPMAVPASDIASRAYSTWYKRPSGEKMVVLKLLPVSFLQKTWSGLLALESYLLDIAQKPGGGRGSYGNSKDVKPVRLDFHAVDQGGLSMRMIIQFVAAAALPGTC